MPRQMTLLWLRESVLGEPLSPLQVDDEMAHFPYSDSCNVGRETTCGEESFKVVYRSLDYGDCSRAFSFSGSTEMITTNQATYASAKI